MIDLTPATGEPVTTLHPDVEIDLAEACMKLAVFGRALAKLDDLDLLDPGATRPDEEAADDPARYRHATRCDSPALFLTDPPLAQAYTAALHAIHKTALHLLAIDRLDDLPARDHPPIAGHTLVVPIAEARGMVIRLTAALRLVERLPLNEAGQLLVLRSLVFLLGPERTVKRGDDTVLERHSALDLPLWKAIATATADGPPPPRRCTNCGAKARPRGTQCTACQRYRSRTGTDRPIEAVRG